MTTTTTKDVALFDFKGATIRVVEIDGQPWFAATDICSVLGMSTNAGTTKWLKYLSADERRLLRPSEHPQIFRGSSASSLTAINESGVYKLVMRSHKPEAREFQDWVTREVLHSIRKNGGYVAGQEKLATGEMTQAEFLAKAVLMSQSVLADMEARALRAESAVVEIAAERDQAVTRLETAAPKAEARDLIASTRGSMAVTEAAKNLKVPPRALFEFMANNGWTYRQGGA